MTKKGKAREAWAWVFLIASVVSIIGFLATINWRFFIPMTVFWFMAVMIIPKEVDRNG